MEQKQNQQQQQQKTTLKQKQRQVEFTAKTRRAASKAEGDAEPEAQSEAKKAAKKQEKVLQRDTKSVENHVQEVMFHDFGDSGSLWGQSCTKDPKSCQNGGLPCSP